MMKCLVNAANRGSCTCPSPNGKLLHPDQQPGARYCIYAPIREGGGERERDEEQQREPGRGEPDPVSEAICSVHTRRLLTTG